jgi:hypothetical protein
LALAAPRSCFDVAALDNVTVFPHLQVSFSILGLVCGLLSNLCFAVRNVATPSSPAAAADGDALFLAINIIATGNVVL